MIGFVVCVNYADYLRHTLPSSSLWFDRLYLISSVRDEETQNLEVPSNVVRFNTDVFWKDGAVFNKFAALEECIDSVSRYKNDVYGIIDADIVFPRLTKNPRDLFPRECLTTPLRRMYYGDLPYPPVEEWCNLPVHRLVRHWSGYAQFFWANDPVLREKKDWFGRNHVDASTGDTVFQSRWRLARKKRPNFEVLHLGPDRVNWQGRKSPRAVLRVPSEVPPCG